MTTPSSFPGAGGPRPALRPATPGGIRGRVGVLVPQLVHWRCRETIEGLAAALHEADLELRLTIADGGLDGGLDDGLGRLAPAPDLPVLDAVVVVGGMVPHAQRARPGARPLPVVLAGDLRAPSPSVSLDDEGAIVEAVRHVVGLGHRRLAMVAGTIPATDSSSCEHRAAAFTRAIRDLGLGDDHRVAARVEPDNLPGAVARLLGNASRPTALVVDSDTLAVHALRALGAMGERVPADVSVIGLGDHPVAELADLTTVRQEPRQQGVVAGDMVAAILRGEPVDDVILPVRVVPRRSTGAPPRRAG